MSKTSYTCTGCMPIDKSIVDTYIALLSADKSVEEAEEARVEAEAGRVTAEESRVTAEGSRDTAEAGRVLAESGRVLAENARVDAETARETQAGNDHTRAEGDHSTAVSDHAQVGEDHTASVAATTRANDAAAAAEHMVDIKTGPQGPQGNTGSSVDYPYELVNNVTTDDATKGLSAAQGVVLDGKISQLGQEVEKMVSDSPEDFSITDESGHAIIEFSEGHFRTKNFDSKTVKEELNIKPNVGEADHDFDIMDESDNVIASFSGGHFRTKNFSSKDLTDKVNEIIENGTKKKISILFVGNSMTQDAISYLPYVLKEIAPDVDFKFYIYYTGGFTLAEQYNNFINEWIPGTFSICENTIQWINHVSWESSSIKQSMKAWLQEINFDILCLQDYFSTQPTTDNAVTDFNNCVNYIRDNYDGQFKVVNLFHRPRTNVFDEHGPQSTLECFNMIKTAAEQCMKNTACQSVMAPGVAAYFATLDSILQPLGDIGNLTPDGSHAQDTLGCLLQAYTVALWLFNEMGLPYGIYNNHIRINQTLFNAINPPGPHVGSGIVIGDDTQNNEAQLVAVRAFKYGLNLVNNSLV